jgi:hypothetical protein
MNTSKRQMKKQTTYHRIFIIPMIRPLSVIWLYYLPENMYYLCKSWYMAPTTLLRMNPFMKWFHCQISSLILLHQVSSTKNGKVGHPFVKPFMLHPARITITFRKGIWASFYNLSKHYMEPFQNGFQIQDPSEKLPLLQLILIKTS